MKACYQKRGKKWQYTFVIANIDGKRKRISKCGFDTKSAAERAATKAMAEYNEVGNYSEPSKISYADFLQNWLDNYCRANLKTSSLVGYGKRIKNYIIPYLGAYKLTMLNAALLQKFINDRAEESLSRNTLVSLKAIISGSLNYAVQQGLLKFNAMLSVRVPSQRNETFKLNSKPNTCIPPDIIRKIFERFPEGTSAHLPLMLGYKCGLRLGEVFALTWDDIDLDKHTLRVNNQVQWDQSRGDWYFSAPKYNSVRTLDIDLKLVDLLRRTKERQEKAKALFGDKYIHYFLTDNQGITTSGQKEIRLILVRDDGSYTAPRIMQHASAVIHHQLHCSEFTFHSLRHTHATMLLENKVPYKYIEERLGHRSGLPTSRIYQHVTDSIRAESREVIEQMFVGKSLVVNKSETSEAK